MPPGLKFWSSGESQGICAQGNAVCVVGYEKGLFSDKKAVTNADCLDASWATKRQEVCRALGDCSGNSTSGKEGVYKYLQAGGFGVTGTKAFLPLINGKSVNQGIIDKINSVT